MNTIIKALGPLIAVALAGSTLLAETGPESHPDKAIPISYSSPSTMGPASLRRERGRFAGLAEGSNHVHGVVAVAHAVEDFLLG